MITTAVPQGEDAPAWFFLDMRDVPWDGTRGVKLIAPWEGQGMRATQSHAMAFEDFPAVRTAWPDVLSSVRTGHGGFVLSMFAAVIIGILDVAMQEATRRLEGRRETLGSFERVEWTRANTEYWLALQAYEGMLRSAEHTRGRDDLIGKVAIAELADSIMRRLSRAVGGGAYSQNSPLGFWLEDVRALGYLRPPWGLAFDALYEESWPETTPGT